MEIMGNLFLPIVFLAIVGYLLGSVNSSILLTKLFTGKGEDIRSHGSGNAGMTNVLRSVGKLPAVLTFVGDFLKCVIAMVVAYFVMKTVCVQGDIPLEFIKLGQCVVGVCCVLGHIFPVFFGFRGGKGVVTSAAMILLLDWRAFLLVIATFLLIFLGKKIISLASVICAAVYPVYTFLLIFFLDFTGSPLASHGDRSLFYLIYVTATALVIGGIVLIKHRSNIGRLRRGEEKPITPKKK